MKKTNSHGFALVELLLGLALIAIVLPLIFQLYIFGQETFSYGTRLAEQQYAVTNVLQHIRGDVQKAAYVYYKGENENLANVHAAKSSLIKLGYYSASAGGPVPDKCIYWRFYCEADGQECTLQKTEEMDFSAPAPGDDQFYTVVKGLDTAACNFYLSESDGNDYMLRISIKPIETNTGRMKSHNVKEAIITEISVLYKELKVD